MSTDEDKKKKLQDEVDRVNQWIITAAENGMFNTSRKNDDSTSNSIVAKLDLARTALAGNNYGTCETEIANAACAYSHALNATNWSWRFANIYGGHIWIYLTLFLFSSIFALYYFKLDQVILEGLGISPLHPAYEIYFNGILAVTWGAIGGIARGIWLLKDNVDDRGFRNSWTVWFLSCPFIGGFFGAVVYFILIAGLISITLDNIDFQNSLVIIAISVVAGFSWPAALEMIKRVSNSFVGSEKEQ